MAHRYELRSHGADGAHPDHGAATFPTTSPARSFSVATADLWTERSRVCSFSNL